ncbi:MAG: hypothetical protein LBL56_07710 [Treponema sp.]|jgi:hypothetical protein|nr:hypothetical protein [Treponema sp.]
MHGDSKLAKKIAKNEELRRTAIKQYADFLKNLGARGPNGEAIWPWQSGAFSRGIAFAFPQSTTRERYGARHQIRGVSGTKNPGVFLFCEFGSWAYRPLTQTP